MKHFSRAYICLMPLIGCLDQIYKAILMKKKKKIQCKIEFDAWKHMHDIMLVQCWKGKWELTPHNEYCIFCQLNVLHETWSNRPMVYSITISSVHSTVSSVHTFKLILQFDRTNLWSNICNFIIMPNSSCRVSYAYSQRILFCESVCCLLDWN